MKKISVIIIHIVFTIMLFAEVRKMDVKSVFNLLNFEDYTLIENRMLSSQSEGVEANIYHNKNDLKSILIDITMCGTMGQTTYLIIPSNDDREVLISKTSYIYNEPYSYGNAEQNQGYFLLVDDLLYYYNITSDTFENCTELSVVPTVVDFKTVELLIQEIRILLEEDINKKQLP